MDDETRAELDSLRQRISNEEDERERQDNYLKSDIRDVDNRVDDLERDR